MRDPLVQAQLTDLEGDAIINEIRQQTHHCPACGGVGEADFFDLIRAAATMHCAVCFAGWTVSLDPDAGPVTVAGHLESLAPSVAQPQDPRFGETPSPLVTDHAAPDAGPRRVLPGPLPVPAALRPKSPAHRPPRGHRPTMPPSPEAPV